MIFAPDSTYSDCLDELARLRVASIKSDLYAKAYEITPSYRKILSAQGVLTEHGQRATHVEFATSLAGGWRLGDVIAMDWLMKDGFVRFARARHEPTRPSRTLIAGKRRMQKPPPAKPN